MFNSGVRRKLLLYRRAVDQYFRSCHSIPRKEGWESVIGLEIHAQISAQSKLFSPAGTKFGVPVNTLVSFTDAAIPGTLPVLNKACVEAAVLTGLTLSCRINEESHFDRKHYFYSDLPAGYQITQQRKAIANDGQLKFIVYNPTVHRKPYYKTSRIQQLQLEQDSGKSLHSPEMGKSLIDLNRAGVALMEIVFHPDLKDGEEAGALVKELTLVLQSIGTCSCKMEEGALRVDANVSVRRSGEKQLGTRTEVKNLSSIRSLVNAIEFEVTRQISLLEGGQSIINETRGYDAVTKQTVPMRDKEVQQDYRFMPEPNLPPLRLRYDPASAGDNSGPVNIAAAMKRMKELPDVTRTRLVKNYNLKLETAVVIVNTPGMLEYFNSVMQSLSDVNLAVKVANVLSMDVLEELNEKDISFHECPVPPSQLVELILLLNSEQINLNTAKSILKLIFDGDTRSPSHIVQEEGLTQTTDASKILKLCEEVLAENPKLVEDAKKKRKPKYINQLIGKVKTKTKGKIDMKKVTEIIEKLVK